MQNLISALIKAKKSIKPICKEAENTTKKRTYSYVTLQDILSSVEPILLENELVVSFQCKEGRMECTLWHSSGESMTSSVDIELFVDDNPEKEMEKPQRVGAAMTYARKYLLMALLNLNTSEPDADSDEYAKKKTQSQNVQHKPVYTAHKQPQAPVIQEFPSTFTRLTNEQLKEIKEIMGLRKISPEDLMQLAYEVTGNPYIKSSLELPYDCYDDLIGAIDTRFPPKLAF
ncbi:essential recombination function protein [Cylindrospermopsis phage Cr-LKS4]|nr:essential recombination function protein [Cylindrospermopsis phage Cr-LKS4]